FVGGRAALERSLQQRPGLVTLAACKRGDALLQQFLRFALALGERAPRPLDVGAGPRVVPIEKQRARPDVDRLIVSGGEIMIEANQEKMLDLCVAIRFRRGVERA